MKIFFTTNFILIIIFKVICQTISVSNDTTSKQSPKKILFENISFADSVIFYDPGALGDNTGEEPSKQYQNSQKALGKPDCVSDKDTGFVSLGNGGTIIIKFTDNILINGPGADLKICEVGNDEPINIWVSSDNRIYLPLNKSADSDYTFDFGTQSLNEHFYTFVKIRDIYDFNPLPDTSDHALGADIDAVVALNTAKRVTFKTDSLFSSEMVDLSEYGKKKLTDLADKIRILSQPVVIINAYSHQKASERYLSLSTYMQADIIRQFLYNQQELSLAEYYISGKGYDENLKYSIIEILIHQKINEKSFNR